MAKGFVHTVNRDGRWVNEIEGDEGSTSDGYETKAAAVAAGREEAMRRTTEHVIHAKDGLIDERNSYGGDPAQRPG